MFNLGDNVFFASFGCFEERVTCPDCLGGKTIKATLVTGESYDVGCGNCARGYDPPSGFVIISKHKAEVSNGVIGGVKKMIDKIEYVIRVREIFESYTYTKDESEVFGDKEEAEARAVLLEVEYNEQEMKRFLGKEKESRTWARNVAYHRGELRRAKWQVEYHEKKLGIAQSKVKEEKESK